MKPENLIFNEDHTKIKIIDMGISSKYKDIHFDEEHVEQRGTFRYMSPEQFDGKISLKTDVWAFGCILMEFATGLRPYHQVPEERIPVLVSEQKISPLDYAITELTDQISIILTNSELRNLIKNCFSYSYVQRWPAIVLKRDKFFKKFQKDDIFLH